MTIVTLHAAGPADPAEAWERYALPARWTEWSPQIKRVESSDTRLVDGTTGRVFGPVGVSIDFVVDSIDEDARVWAWTVHLRPAQLARVRLHLHHAVVADARGSATTLRIEGPLPLVVPYAPVARYALTRLVAH